MTKDARHWAQWFWGTFFPDWLARVHDDQGGVFDALDADGTPDFTANKSLLAQARTLFTLSHAALASGDPNYVAAAQRQLSFLRRFQKSPGLYRCMAKRDGTQTGSPEDEYARSYDHSFVILGLVTLNKLAPSDDVGTLIDQCWDALMGSLLNQSTGLLRNEDSGADTGPAQNPHMHLYEACLQAFRMTNDPVWLARAADLRTVGLRHFLDESSGSITEFLTPNLRPLPGPAGERREVGHQCEWAWLLHEEAMLAGTTAPRLTAKRLFDFAETNGFAQDGPLKGAVFDAVTAQGVVTENSFLLWPQTEAIKMLAIRHSAGVPHAGDRASALMSAMFAHWFDGRPSFVNQLDASGNTLWSQGLTRLIYHVVLAMTEGARAGLWPEASQCRTEPHNDQPSG